MDKPSDRRIPRSGTLASTWILGSRSCYACDPTVWISSAVAFTIVEDVGEGKRINSFGDALWWSATTISTVGYGDIYPLTSAGRTIAVLTTIVGVSTFGVVTAKLASVLVRN